MTASDVQHEILDPMQRLYLPPRSMEETQQSAALREYVSALQAFDATELNVAWTTVRDTHTTRSWPVPAAFVMAARQARKTIQPQQKARGTGGENDHWETWKAVSRSPLAYEAVKRNVAWSLKCAVLHDGKKPEQVSITELVSRKHSAEKLAERLRRGETTMSEKDAHMALRMWDGLLERETETQGEIRFSAERGTSRQ